MTPEERRRLLFDAERAGLRVIEDVKRDRPREFHKVAARRIFDIERDQNGSRFFASDRAAYVLDGVGRDVHPIDREDVHFSAWLNTRYGLSKSAKETRLVVEFLHDRTLVYGEQIKPSRFTHYDASNNTLYVDCNDGQAWVLNGRDPPRLVLNGQGVFFRSNPAAPSLSGASILPHGILLDTLVNDLNYAPVGKFTAAAQRQLFAAWIHLLGFGDWDELANGKPLLIIEGAMRSGKTTAIKRVAQLFHHNASPLIVSENGEADLSTQLLHGVPIAHFDNQDRFIKWMPDAIAAYCTSGVWRKRKLHTDDTLHEIRPNCFVAVTSADPKSFRRPDIVDRSIPLRLVQYSPGTEGHEGLLSRRVIENRDHLVGEWMYGLNRILAELPRVNIERPTSRMVGWETFFTACRTALGFDAEVDALVQVKDERLEFATEEDPTIDWMDRWLENAGNIQRRLTGAALHEELKVLSTKGLPIESTFTKRWPTAMGFAKWLRNAAEFLGHKGIVMETHPNPDRTRYSTPVYAFSREE